MNSADRAIIDALALASNEAGTPITEEAYNADINRILHVAIRTDRRTETP